MIQIAGSRSHHSRLLHDASWMLEFHAPRNLGFHAPSPFTQLFSIIHARYFRNNSYSDFERASRTKEYVLLRLVLVVQEEADKSEEQRRERSRAQNER